MLAGRWTAGGNIALISGFSLGLGIGAGPAFAQLRSEVVVSGLNSPVAFVQDPTLADTQYVVEQSGRIRVVRAGQLSVPDFLDLHDQIRAGGEQGLLGLAFAPDYGSSGRAFVHFSNPSGNHVIARFRRSTTDPRRLDASSRFDLRWSDGNRFIAQPYSNHNGGNLQFGPDGYLYIGLGDGGSGDDPGNRAQTGSTLLGKMLRIDVNVSDADPAGYAIPADNPFVGRAGYLAEIWDIGLRNPWRYSFDSFGIGATGALIIGDVGQSSYEEIDYEPMGRGGRNYGWRYREGAHNHVTSIAPAFLPLTDPTYDYGRTLGGTVIGGFVYRGTALPATYRGRYFFADYVNIRVWSMSLTPGANGEATAGPITDHTVELGGASRLGNPSSFGIDSRGELYLVSYGRGEILRIAGTAPSSNTLMTIDTPTAGAVVQPFPVAGWAIDTGDTGTGTGIDTVHVWAFPTDGRPPIFLGSHYGASRSDLAAAYGAKYLNSGYAVTVTGLASGSYVLSANAHSTVTGQFEASRTVQVSVSAGRSLLQVDGPPPGVVATAFQIVGWAVDLAASTGSGIDAVHAWAFPVGGGSPVFAGAASLGGARPDVGAVFGAQFTSSGYHIAASVAPGVYDLNVYARSAVTGTFDVMKTVRMTVR